jgi:eukaryotic-like serine/threonine-protein kinase
VKVLREEFAGDSGFLERFRTEARNSAQLSHPNIAALYDYGEQEGSGFLVMELVLGEPMSDLLDRQPVLPTRRLLPILAQTARALHAAHVAGVVHRDVKPGNILLARSGRVKITDFGISTASNQVPMTASGMVMGTAQYLSPEQAIGRAATPASDIYSLGIVAYEGLVGHRPFTGPTAVDIAVAHVNTPVPPLPGTIDPALAALVMRMLSKDPVERPRSAASLARHLDDMVGRTPSEGVPLPLGRHARPVDVAHASEQAPSGRRTAVNGSEARVPSTGELLAATGGIDEEVPSRRIVGGFFTGASAVTQTAGASGPEEPAAPARSATATRTPPEGAVRPGEPSTDRPVPAGVGARPGEAVPSQPAVADDPLPATGPTPVPAPVPVPGRPAGAGRPLPEPPPVVLPTGPAVARRPAQTRPTRPAGTRTSTTTGQRWRGVSHPLVAIVLMVVFALLGAAFAQGIWGSPGAAGHDPDTIRHLAVDASEEGGPHGGMIHARPDRPGLTTTARDQ